MRGDDVRRLRDYPKITDAELRDICSSRDWRERMVRLGEDGGPDVHSRLCALARTRRAVLARDRIPAFGADVAFVHDVCERRWLEDFLAFVQDPARAASAHPFDERLLFELPAPGCQGRNGVVRPHAHVEDRRLERVARSMKGAWIPAHDAIHVTRLLAAQRALWPSVPSVWMDMEVPYRLRSGTPLVVRTHGLLMAHYEYGGPTMVGDADSARARAAWCAALSQSVQLVAGELLDECARFGRLFWLPSSLIAIMRDMGGVRLLGAVTGRRRLLEHILNGIESVRWDLVDPCGTVCAKSTTFGTPVFLSGDAVSWDSSVKPDGALAVVPCLRRPLHERPLRGQRLWGYLTPAGRREPCHGWGLRRAQWRGVPVDQMRVNGPRGWEREAAARWSEHLNRLRGVSASGVQRELLRLDNNGVDQSVDSRGDPRVPVSATAVDFLCDGHARNDPHELRRVRMDNTPAWVSRQRTNDGSKRQVFTDMPPPLAIPPTRIGGSERQSACRTAKGAMRPDRYSAFPWECRQDLAVQVMSSLLEISSETGRLGEVVAEDIRRLLMDSAHAVIRDLVPPHGQVMHRPSDDEVRQVSELMQRVLKKTPGRHSANPQVQLMNDDHSVSERAPSNVQLSPSLNIRDANGEIPPGSSGSHANLLLRAPEATIQQAPGAVLSSKLGTCSEEVPTKSQVTLKRRAILLDTCQYPRTNSPKRRRMSEHKTPDGSK